MAKTLKCGKLKFNPENGKAKYGRVKVKFKPEEVGYKLLRLLMENKGKDVAYSKLLFEGRFTEKQLKKIKMTLPEEYEKEKTRLKMKIRNIKRKLGILGSRENEDIFLNKKGKCYRILP